MGKALDLVAVLAALAAAAAGQQYNPITEFCRRFSHEGPSPLFSPPSLAAQC
jgi:hypothetical protein